MVQAMTNPLKLADMTRGRVVSFEWPNHPTGDLAKEKGLRPLAKVVTKEDLPNMGDGPIGLQLLDDPMWVMNPELAMSKGRKFFAAPENVLKASKKGARP